MAVPFVPAIVTVVVVPFTFVAADVLVFGDCCGTEAGCGLTEAAGACDLGEAADAANLSDFLPRKLLKMYNKVSC